MGFLKDLGSLTGSIAGVVLSTPVTLAGGFFDSDTLKEAARGIHYVTASTGSLIGQTVSGGLDVVEGVLTRNDRISQQGLDEVGDSFKTVINGVIGGTASLLDNSGKVITGVFEGDTATAMQGAKNLAKFGIITAIGIGLADAIGIVDVNGNETVAHAQVPSSFSYDQDDAVLDYSDIGEPHGLVPDVPVDDIPGVDNGMAHPSATEVLIDLGCQDGTEHVVDPPRDPGMVQAFLTEHGYTETPDGYEVHHIIPLSEGGADHPANMVLVLEEEHDQITAAHQRFYQW
ncbi:MAG: HNH endonuclease signature motif containing protein [Bacillota bacterium]|jgi:hypothetical protein